MRAPRWLGACFSRFAHRLRPRRARRFHARKPLASDTLRALTIAALALPGLAQPATAAGGNEFGVQYGHYEEGARNLEGQTYVDLNLRPIEVGTLSADMSLELTDRLSFGLNFDQDTWSGATPVVTMPHAAVSYQLYAGASAPTGYYTDSRHTPITVNWESYDGTTVDTSPDPNSVHLMASASPETRKQVDFNLGWTWMTAALEVAAGISEETDYHSRFVGMNGRADFDRRLTTLNWGWSYTRSAIEAGLDANDAADWGAYEDMIRLKNGANTLYADRQDVAVNLGLTRILNKGALIEGSLGFARGTGFMEIPYKAVMLAFDDPGQDTGGLDVREVKLQGVLEQRPDVRNQWVASLRFVQHIARLDAALHLDYRFFRDDWGIKAHTFEAAWDQPLGRGWMITPAVRAYSQTAARFYQPYFYFNQAYPVLPGTVNDLDHSRLAIDEFASDHRLSGFGALSGQLTVGKRFANGLSLELGYESYRHAGSLKWGGGGEADYADFKSSLVHAALKLDVSARPPGDAPDAHAGHAGASGPGDHEAHLAAPAGVLFDHVLGRAGEWMVGYRYASTRQSGDTLHGSAVASDAAIIANGCGAGPCYLMSTSMSMDMHMLDVMYAPTDWLTVMLMPSALDMAMDMQPIDGAPPLPDTGDHHHGSGVQGHSTGGLGDTGLYTLFRLFEGGGHRLNAAFGLGLPTGDVHEKLNGTEEFIHYGMQLGSGTWDALLGLTYTGQASRWSWGAQFKGAKRLENKNNAGYALGDALEGTAWGGCELARWMSLTLRGVYAEQGSIEGEFEQHLESRQVGQTLVGTELVPVYERVLESNSVFGPMDVPGSYGGRYADVGLGLSAFVTGGSLAGNRLSLEWLQPVKDDVRGYQLERSGSLVFSWTFGF